MILVYDTETTGFYQDRLPVDHPSQPYIVQLAAQLCEDNGNTVGGFSVVVFNNIKIPESASAVHGITTEKMMEFGIPQDAALSMFHYFCCIANMAVAHNAKFDKALMDTAFAREFDSERIFDLPHDCTMELAAPIVNLPPTSRMLAAGINKPKPPKLEECIKHFFGEELEGAHDAMVDVEACKRIYWHLCEMDQEKAGE